MSSKRCYLVLALFLLVAIAGGQWSSAGSTGLSSAVEEAGSIRTLDWITIKNYKSNENLLIALLKSDVGHNWVEISTEEGEESYGWFGTGPFSGGTVNLNNPKRDRNHGRDSTSQGIDPIRYSEYHPVLTKNLTDKEVLDKVHEFVELQRKERPGYNIFFNNCLDFQEDLMDYVGLEKPPESSPGYPSEEGSSDGNPPIVAEFKVTPLTTISGESFKIDYIISDNGGSGLKQVELWRNCEASYWRKIARNTLAGENGPISGSFTDSPPAVGKYWYGMHVIDNAGNSNDQRNSNSNYQPVSFEPVEVEVTSPEESIQELATLTLYVHDGSASGPIIQGVQVTGYDAVWKSFYQNTDSNGFVMLTGSPGTWQFTITKSGYSANSWSQQIKGTSSTHAYLARTIGAENVQDNPPLNAPSIEWVNIFGDVRGDIARSVQSTSDGGYVMAGDTNFDSSGNGDAWLIKTDSKGNEVWSKTFGGAKWDMAHSVQVTRDGGYILAGETESFGGCYAWLIKTDSQGNEVWSKTFGNAESERCSAANSVLTTPDGCYVLAGSTYGAGNYVAWLIKTDSQGNKIWSKTFGGYKDDTAKYVLQSKDGGYILVGETESYGAGKGDAWLIKTDPEGNEVWNRTFGTEWSNDYAYSVKPTSDGNYILVGWIYGGPRIIKTDSEGKEIWNRTFSNIVNSVQVTSDGGYILAGSYHIISRGYCAWLIKTDAMGNETWNCTVLDDTSGSAAHSVLYAQDEGYILAGETASNPGDFTDAFLIKVRPG